LLKISTITLENYCIQKRSKLSENSTMQHCFLSPISQFFPLVPFTQRHLYWFTSSTQLPPLAQGLESHSFNEST